MNRLLILPICFLVFFNISCKKEPSTPLQVNSDPEYFPAKVGSFWTYKYEQELPKESDTVSVRIINEFIDANKIKTSVWQRISKFKTETLMVKFFTDTIRIFYIENNSQNLFTKLILPCSVGNSWSDERMGTCKVDSLVSVNISAGNFSNCFFIIQKGGWLNDYYTNQFWFVPKIGFIKMTENLFGFSFSKRTWELIDYKIIP